MASDGAAPIAGTHLVSGTPTARIVCEALDTHLKITQINLSLLQSPALFAVVPDTRQIMVRTNTGRAGKLLRSSRPTPYAHCARRRQRCLMVTLSTARVTVSGPAELDM